MSKFVLLSIVGLAAAISDGSCRAEDQNCLLTDGDPISLLQVESSIKKADDKNPHHHPPWCHCHNPTWCWGWCTTWSNKNHECLLPSHTGGLTYKPLGKRDCCMKKCEIECIKDWKMKPHECKNTCPEKCKEPPKCLTKKCYYAFGLRRRGCGCCWGDTRTVNGTKTKCYCPKNKRVVKTNAGDKCLDTLGRRRRRR